MPPIYGFAQWSSLYYLLARILCMQHFLQVIVCIIQGERKHLNIPNVLDINIVKKIPEYRYIGIEI